MSSNNDIEKLIYNHRRRLQILEEQKALHGISVDPKIILEIEDIKTAIKELQAELDEVKVKVETHAHTSVKMTSRDVMGTIPTDEQAVPNVFENPNLLVGTPVGSYNLFKFLGSGGSGLVYRASHSMLGKEVALKLFYPLNPEFGDFYERFKQGFRALGALEHPNIVKIIDFGETEVAGKKTFFLAMEYVNGTDLETWSQTIEKSVNVLEQRLYIALQIAQALQVAHKTTYRDSVGIEIRGVLHGDLKPANIFITNKGEAKLLDFLLVDIQRLLDPQIVSPRLLKTWEPGPITGAFGTPGFMAPEQQEQGIITTKTDIYGLGITFWYLFAPNVKGERQLMQMARSGLPSEVLKLFMEKMIIPKSPESRPNIQEVVDILQTAYDNLTQTAQEQQINKKQNEQEKVGADRQAEPTQKPGLVQKIKKWFG